MTTDNTPLPRPIDPVAFMELFSRSGLSANELRVAAALAECARLIEGEPNLQLARWEIAEMTGLPQTTAQRALSSLAAAGFIGRSQDAKAKGEVAITTVTERLLGLFGLAGGISAPAEAPNELLNLLVRESVEVANGIIQAWVDATMPAAHITSAFRGGSRRWAQIEFLLLGRVEATVMKKAEEAEAKTSPAAKVPLPDGNEIVFCQDSFRSHVPDRNTAMAGADVRFAAEVLTILSRRAPKLLRSKSAAALAAEALYSRQKGFVFKHDFEDAARIVASIMVKGKWSAPRGIDSHWYAAVGASMKVAHRVSKSGALN